MIPALAARAVLGGLGRVGGSAMLEIDVRDHATPYVSAFFSKQMPFTISKALNDTAKDFQKAQRARLDDLFTLRRKQWAERSIKISPFSTKTRQEVRISVDPAGGRSDILGKFETDTSKKPISGSHIAVPVEARRNKSGIVRAKDRPRRAIAEGRAFVRKTGGREAIFERLAARAAGRAGKSIRLMYALVDQVPIKPDLQFEKTARRVVSERWGPNFRAAFERAIRTAK